MALRYAEVLPDVLELMTQLADDWEYSGQLTADTYLFADLDCESLDLVVLGTMLQERYGRLPFAEFLAQLGQQDMKDVTVGQLVEFICNHAGTAAGAVL